MTVGELKKVLENLEDDMEVMVDCYDCEGFEYAVLKLSTPKIANRY